MAHDLDRRAVVTKEELNTPSPSSFIPGVSIIRAVFCDSIPPLRAFILWTASAYLARSAAVVRRPAAAISGYTCHSPGTLIPAWL